MDPQNQPTGQVPGNIDPQYPYGSPQAPGQNGQPDPNGVISSGGDKGSSKGPGGKKGLIIAAVAGGALLLLMLVAALISSGGGTDNPDNQQNGNNGTQTQLQQPATALDIEQTNNALSQDISGLDNEKDFPANALEDQTLEL